ncbi:dimethylaniline monooxygenase [N-oxide-forming] 4-like [Saccostrea echinata]|uniref:dimethylaniline monooxygenase [N-oxide-forming] 4-like n=1 Tax=Saccostrea echinata TaxID=191078 RepID=UPI002A803DDD|nr:dimethylaniline monooxygenase [N-oxide-forming] 4-like [Saccostrea echinata]
MSENTVKQRVAVIGAGPAGLCCLKHLCDNLSIFEPVAFERNFWPCGLWNYTDQTNKDDFGLPTHSAIYNNLTTNLPKEIQEFPDFPYPKEWTTSYITHQQCLQYLNMFADHFKLRPYIRTHIFVRDVKPLKEAQENCRVKWLVTFSPVNKLSEVITEVFDSVLVCNGHYSKAYIPNISGMELFEGRIIHSKEFRHEEHFDGLRVAILGCNYSGEDISLHVVQFAKKVFACHRRKPEGFTPSFPKEIEQRPPFVRMTNDSVVFPDGSCEKVDAVIFCTGYRYSFPFLKDDIITIKDERIQPIYKHMFHIEYPNLIFIGIARQILYFPQYYEMAKLAALVFAGKVKLPSKEEMMADSEADFQSRLKEGKPSTFAHCFGDINFGRRFRYNEELAKLGGFDPLPPVLEMIFRDIADERFMNLPHCNKISYRITGPKSYVCLNPEKIKSRKSKAENVVKDK